MKKLNIVEKAWSVYHEGMIENEYGSYRSVQDIDPVYAETRGQAKNYQAHLYDYDIDGETYKFTDIRAVRFKDMDKVKYKDSIVTRRYYNDLILRDKRIEQLKSLPDNEFYYVQDRRSYVGNAVLWWGEKGGYVCDIKKACKYTKEKLLKTFSDGIRDTDVVWKESHVKKATKLVVDMQYLDFDFSI